MDVNFVGSWSASVRRILVTLGDSHQVTRVIHFLYSCVWGYASVTLCPACVHLDSKHSVACEWLLVIA